MASKGINVKIARNTLINELTSVLGQMSDAMYLYEIEHDQYQKDVEAWKKKLQNIAIKKGKVDSIDSRFSWTGSPKVDVTYVLEESDIPERPEEPTKPYRPSGYGRNYTGGYEDRVAEITNAIRILELSEDEYVSASTYGAVSKYL
jgi:hypothetical protein